MIYMNEYEKKLFDNGFTTKDIGKLRSIVKRMSPNLIPLKLWLLI